MVVFGCAFVIIAVVFIAVITMCSKDDLEQCGVDLSGQGREARDE